MATLSREQVFEKVRSSGLWVVNNTALDKCFHITAKNVFDINESRGVITAGYPIPEIKVTFNIANLNSNWFLNRKDAEAYLKGRRNNG